MGDICTPYTFRLLFMPLFLSFLFVIIFTSSCAFVIWYIFVVFFLLHSNRLRWNSRTSLRTKIVSTAYGLARSVASMITSRPLTICCKCLNHNGITHTHARLIKNTFNTKLNPTRTSACACACVCACACFSLTACVYMIYIYMYMHMYMHEKKTKP